MNIPTDGSNPCQSIAKAFQLSRPERDMLSKQEYDVQAWCMLLNDKVTFKMQWSQYADLQINGEPARAINRPGSQLLEAYGRDDGPVVLNAIPGEAEGYSFADALVAGGGPATENADSDSEIEVVAEC